MARAVARRAGGNSPVPESHGLNRSSWCHNFQECARTQCALCPRTHKGQPGRITLYANLHTTEGSQGSQSGGMSVAERSDTIRLGGAMPGPVLGHFGATLGPLWGHGCQGHVAVAAAASCCKHTRMPSANWLRLAKVPQPAPEPPVTQEGGCWGSGGAVKYTQKEYLVPASAGVAVAWRAPQLQGAHRPVFVQCLRTLIAGCEENLHGSPSPLWHRRQSRARLSKARLQRLIPWLLAPGGAPGGEARDG